MPLIDHSKTRVLLIGVSDFPEDPTIASIPNVKANLQLLKASLTNPELVGIPEANISISLNENKNQIERKLYNVVEETRDRNNTLLIYYTGHGILSATDFELYLTTHYTHRKYLESDGINIEIFKRYIRRSLASRKIVILDCCHSGAIIGSMGEFGSKLQAELNQFEGTYVMTSSAEDEPSLYPVKSADEPTYFTGKLISVVNEGLDTDSEFCSLRDIYNKIETDFRYAGLPRPQQSNFNTADLLFFARNKKYVEKKADDEIAWDMALQQNAKWSYVDFRKQYPTSKFARLAKQKVYEIEEEEHWERALERNTVFSFTDYLDTYPTGKNSAEANAKLAELRRMDEQHAEELLWNQVSKSSNLLYLKNFITKFPNGKYAAQCVAEIERLQKKEEQERMKIIEEQNQKRIREEEEARQLEEEEKRKQYEKEQELKRKLAEEQKRIVEEQNKKKLERELEEKRRIAEEQKKKKIEQLQQEEQIRKKREIEDAEKKIAEELKRKKLQQEEDEKSRIAKEQSRLMMEQQKKLHQQELEEQRKKKLAKEQEEKQRALDEQHRQDAELRKVEEQKKKEQQVREYERKGDQLVSSGQLEEAIAIYEKALILQPGRPNCIQAIQQCKRLLKDQREKAEKPTGILIRENAFSGTADSKKRMLVIAGSVILGLIIIISIVMSLSGNSSDEKIEPEPGLNQSYSEYPNMKTYKFVVVTTSDKLRAWNSYKLYSSMGRDIKLDSSNPGTYKLYFNINASPADTLKIRDSLNRYYYANSSTIKVIIEE